jgi:hypothetical protein
MLREFQTTNVDRWSQTWGGVFWLPALILVVATCLMLILQVGCRASRPCPNCQPGFTFDDVAARVPVRLAQGEPQPADGPALVGRADAAGDSAVPLDSVLCGSCFETDSIAPTVLRATTSACPRQGMASIAMLRDVNWQSRGTPILTPADCVTAPRTPSPPTPSVSVAAAAAPPVATAAAATSLSRVPTENPLRNAATTPRQLR